MFYPMDIGILFGVALLVFGPKKFNGMGGGPPGAAPVVRQQLLSSKVIKTLPRPIEILLNPEKHKQ